MKKMMAVLTFIIAVFCVILSGCGKQPGDEFVGTWKREYTDTDDRPGLKYHQDVAREYYLVIEPNENGKSSFIMKEYTLKMVHTKTDTLDKTKQDSSKRQFPVQYKDGVLEKDFSMKYYIENGQLKMNNEVYDRVSDKSMTFDEMNNGRGYPEPK